MPGWRPSSATSRCSCGPSTPFDDVAWNGPSPAGTGTLGAGVGSISVDAYLHADDIRSAVGRPTEVAGVRASTEHPGDLQTEQGHAPIDGQRVADIVRAELQRRIIACNAAASGHHDGRTLTFVVRVADALVAGLDGFTWGSYAEVEFLFVAEEHRGRGLGSSLLAPPRTRPGNGGAA